jgi:AcrR family transcriptional regulator
MSAEERREDVIRVALQEFARGGFVGTSTETIAKRVGVSQPYLFRLFPNKKAIFLAAARRCFEEIRDEMCVGEGQGGEEVLLAMAKAYGEIITKRPELLLMQMQACVAVAAADEAGEPELGEVVRACWMELWDAVHLRLGAEVAETTTFMAFGMLINVQLAMGFPSGHRVWEGMYPEARPAFRPPEES